MIGKKRKISMIGKITIIKTLVIPNITYTASLINLCKETISKFKKMIYNFLWDGGSEKVKRSVLRKNYLDRSRFLH